MVNDNPFDISKAKVSAEKRSKNGSLESLVFEGFHRKGKFESFQLKLKFL